MASITIMQRQEPGYTRELPRPKSLWITVPPETWHKIPSRIRKQLMESGTFNESIGQSLCSIGQSLRSRVSNASGPIPITLHILSEVPLKSLELLMAEGNVLQVAKGTEGENTSTIEVFHRISTHLEKAIIRNPGHETHGRCKGLKAEHYETDSHFFFQCRSPERYQSYQKGLTAQLIQVLKVPEMAGIVVSFLK